MALPGKPVRLSHVEATHIVLTGDTNALHTAFGGTILGWCDIAAAVAAGRHAQRPAVTASIDSVHFVRPIHAGDVVVLRASVNSAAHTSMEVGVKVYAESPISHERRHACTAYLTFVALDDEGRPTEVPPVLAETDVERRRLARAEERRARRLEERARSLARAREEDAAPND